MNDIYAKLVCTDRFPTFSSWGTSDDLAAVEGRIAEIEPAPVSEPAEKEIASVPSSERPENVVGPDTPLCISTDGVCAAWLHDARDECVENYPLTQKSERDAKKRLNFEDCVFDFRFKPFQGIVPQRYTGKIGPDLIAQGERLQAVGWDQPQTQPAKWVVYADVPKTIVEAAREGVRAAEKYLGSFGPLTVYIIGNDLAAAEPVIADLCNGAYEKNAIEYCIQQDQGPGIRDMVTIFPGGNAFNQTSYHLDSPNQPFVDNPCVTYLNEFRAIKFPEELVGTRRVTAQEYFHVYQGSQGIHRDEDNPAQTPMPRWFEDGTVTYFQMVLDEQKKWTKNARASTILGWQESMKDQQSRWPSLRLIDIESEVGTQRVGQYCGELCIGYLQYDVGFGEIAYLAQLTYDVKLIFDFYKASKTENFYTAFEKIFGMTINKFYAELDEFSALPQEKQFKILAG